MDEIKLPGASVLWRYLYKYGFWFLVHIKEMSFGAPSILFTLKLTWLVFCFSKLINFCEQFLFITSLCLKRDIEWTFFRRELGRVKLVKLNYFLDWNRSMQNLEGTYVTFIIIRNLGKVILFKIPTYHFFFHLKLFYKHVNKNTFKNTLKIHFLFAVVVDVTYFTRIAQESLVTRF